MPTRPVSRLTCRLVHVISVLLHDVVCNFPRRLLWAELVSAAPRCTRVRPTRERGAGVLSFSVWWPKPANAQQVRAHQPYSYGECTMPESRVQFRHAPRFCLFGLEFSSLDSSCLRMPECAPAAQFNHTASENGAFNAVSAHGLLCSALRHGLRHCWASVNLCRARSGGRCVSALLPPLIVCFPLARSSSARRARRRRKLPS